MKPTTAAQYLDVSLAEFYNIIKEHKIPAVRYHERGVARYRKKTLDDWLEHQENKAA